jgi:GNAT superfamily N-acetyltransferase
MLDIRQVSFREVIEGVDLFDYARECALPEMGDVDPNLKVYETLERSGSMFTFAAFSDDYIVGFATVLIYEVPHYSKKVATTESLFVMPRFRTTPAGIRLMKFIESFAKSNGCTVFFYSAPVHSQLDKYMTFRKTGRHSNNIYLVTL